MSDSRVPFKSIVQRSWLSSGLILALSIAPLASAYAADTSAAANSSTQRQSLNIPAQDLSSALNALAAQTGTQITANSALLTGLRSNPLDGYYSVQEAFALLLKNTGLEASPSGQNNYTIGNRRSSDTGPVMLDNIATYGSYLAREELDTATGLGLKPQETPQSITILTEQRIEDQGLVNLKQAVLAANGVSSTEYDNVRNTFMSRGFDVENYQIDGVPISWNLAGDAGETVTDLAIYERIEFVRGATGLLTGIGEPSASINLVRKKAERTEFGGDIGITAGSWKRKEIYLDAGSALNKSATVRARVVAKHMQGESFQDLYEDDKDVLYGVVEADLSDSTLLRFGASYEHSDPTAASWGGLTTQFSDGSETDWNVSKTSAADWTEWETESKNLFVNLSHYFNNGWKFRANINHLNYEQNTKLVYLYGSLDKATGEGLIPSIYKSAGKSVQDSIDVALSGDYLLFGQLHEFTLGALRSVQTLDGKSYSAISGSYSTDTGNFYDWDGSFNEPEWSTEGTVTNNLTTLQQGYYGVTRMSLTDQLKVIVGGRINTWQRDDAGTKWGDSQVFTPYAGALYDITENHRGYLSYTQIFKPQDERNINAAYLDPVTGTNQEIGLKSRYFNGAMETNIAIFRIEQDDLAQADGSNYVDGTEPLADGGDGSLEQAYVAADGVESTGFEAEVVGKPVDNWQVNAGYSQFEAKDADDLKVNTHQPRRQFKLFTTYNFPGSLAGLTVGGGINWQAETYSTSGSIRLTQDAYYLANLMARYRLNDTFSTQLNVYNLFDEKYYSMVNYAPQYRYGSPRNFSLSVTAQF